MRGGRRLISGLALVLALFFVLPAAAHPLTELIDRAKVKVPELQPTPAPTGAGPPVPCQDLDVPYNRWIQLPAPGPELVSMGSFAQSPCTFIAGGSDGRVYLSSDAGGSWEPALDLGAGRTIYGIVTEEAPAGTAFVLSSPGAGEGPTGQDPGLHVTRNFGRTFEPVADLSGLAVTALAVAPGDSQVMYLAAGPELALPLGKGHLFKSTDFGNTWTPLPGALPIAPSRLAVDPLNPEVVWGNSDSEVRAGAPAGLWLSDNGGLVWTRVDESVVVDLDTAAIVGSSRLDAATDNGILRTRDLGASFSVEIEGEPVASLGHEPFLPQVIMAVVGGEIRRSIDEGDTFAATPGLPPLGGCATDLIRNEELTAHFLLSISSCDASGFWLYRSDGLDVLGAGYFDVPDSGLLAGRRPRVDMDILREVAIPRPVGNSMGTVAFDGRLLYYTANTNLNHIYSMTPSGVDVGEIVLYPDIHINSMTYDSTHNSLWLVTPSVGSVGNDSANVYEVDLDTGTATFRFTSPLGVDTSISYDPSLGHFRSYEHHGYAVHEIGMNGELLASCEVPAFPADPNVSLNPDRGHAENPIPGFASGIAAGNGNIYLNLEDDRTIYYVSRACEILVVLEHRRFQEATTNSSGARYESDQLACDTTTFGRPAIWIRDAASATMVAYAVPDGYCPLDTFMEVVPEKTTVTEGRQAFICARLRIADTVGSDGLIAGQEIRFFVGGIPTASALTDGFGLACIKDVFQRGGARLEIQALFFGNSAYRSARASGLVVVIALPKPPAPLPPVPPIAPPPILQVAPGPPPPARPEIPAPQPQPQPQGQAQANAALAAQEQQQPQLAFVNATRQFEKSLAEEYAMSSQRDDDQGSNLRAMMLAAALMSMAYASLSLAKSRVRTAQNRR